MKLLLLFACLLVPRFARSQSPQDLLKHYEEQARAASSFKAFSSEQGRELYFKRNVKANSEQMSCASCHTENPKGIGKTKVGKAIEPLAPSANRKRFTELAKAEKWFKRNCKDVFERECTIQEKGDFLAYMMSIK